MTSQEQSTKWRDAAALEPLLSVSVPRQSSEAVSLGWRTERLARAIDEHVQAERDAIEAYGRLAKSPDALISLVAYLILEDERMHHELCRRIVGTLAGAPDSGQPNALPHGGMAPKEAAEGLRMLRALAKRERSGAQFLDAASRAHLEGDDKLSAILLRAMALDSRKHELLLTFLAQHSARLAKL